MTNILEKSLLTGFGIFLLIIFLSFIAPFITSIMTFNSNDNNNLDSYISFIDEIDKGINYVIEFPENVYLQTIEYPNNFNMSFRDYIAKFIFKYDGTYQIKILEYSVSFIEFKFENIPPQFYMLNISIKSSKILIKLG